MKKQSEIAKLIAEDAHAGQFRRDGKTPYIEHPAAVAKWLCKEDDDIIAAAWLHDVLEDTKITANDLRIYGIEERIVEAVIALTKTEHPPMVDNLRMYFNVVRDNDIARKVKIADMICNLADSPTPNQIKRYAWALNHIVEVFTNDKDRF